MLTSLNNPPRTPTPTTTTTTRRFSGICQNWCDWKTNDASRFGSEDIKDKQWKNFTLVAKYNTQAVVIPRPPWWVSCRRSGYLRSASELLWIVFLHTEATFPLVLVGTALLLFWLHWAPLRKHP